MRPTGRLHLGHLHGVLNNWVRLQHEYECFFFVADYHALTTNYEHSESIDQFTFDTVVDWLAAGVNPGAATIFVQSKVPEHAELHLMLSMITPLSWLERVPSYKDQQQKLKDRDLATYGFLGYPLLQAADILIYRAGRVPVGADQVAHVELTREVARRFNHIYGREPGFEEQAEAAVKKMGKKAAKLYVNFRREYLERGDAEALERARALLSEQQNLSIGDTERLFGYLEGGGRIILPEPQSLLSEQAKMPGLDGEKMSKSLGNFRLVNDLLKQYPGEVLRYVILSAHYRSEQNFSKELLDSAWRTLDTVYGFIRGIDPQAAILNRTGEGYKALLDDINTPVAISELYRLAKAANQAQGAEQQSLMAELAGLADILGLLQQDPEQWFTVARGDDQLTAEQIEEQIQARQQAKQDRDFAKADQIRQQLLDAGVVLEDSREGTQWRRA